LNTLSDEVASTLGQSLCQRIGRPRYELWFQNKTKFTWQTDRLVVGVPNYFYQEWLQKKFTSDLRAVAREVLGEALDVGFLIDPELFQNQRQQQQTTPVTKMTPAVERRLVEAPTPVAALAPTRLRRWKRLEDFVVGPCNRVAYASAMSILEDPGSCPTPLVLHGPVGVGKSHLLEGVYLALKEQYDGARLLFLTAEEFTNRFLGAMHQQKQGGFRRQFRECDALLIDDLHFLARKTATQEEFLHTLEALQRDGRPVIVTCDCHPKLADIFLPELTDRLAGGAVWSMAVPDPATRRRLIGAKLGEGATLVPEIVELLAERLRGNVRELEGALHSIRHLARVTARPITRALAQEALADVLRSSVRSVQLADIERVVGEVLELPGGTLQSRQRRTQASHPRMLAMYLARKHTSATYSEVGHHFGRRNHSTVVAAEKKVRLWVAAKESVVIGNVTTPVRDLIERIESELAR
jgi:chromosomal replication initiator protein